MADVVDRVSDQDDADANRKRRVGAKCNVVFESVFNLLRERVLKYNERHPQGFGFPNAMFLNEGPFSSSKCSLDMQKNTEPHSSLTLEFPINSGSMQVECSAESGKSSISIEIDIVSDTPTYSISGNSHSAEALAELLIGRLVAPGLREGWTKIGFV